MKTAILSVLLAAALIGCDTGSCYTCCANIQRSLEACQASVEDGWEQAGRFLAGAHQCEDALRHVEQRSVGE